MKIGGHHNLTVHSFIYKQIREEAQDGGGNRGTTLKAGHGEEQ